MTPVPFLDLKAMNHEVRDEIEAAFYRVQDRGHYVLGPEVAAFEAEFAEFSGVKHCIGVGTGLDALFLSLKALDIGPGCEVIVPATTFIATWLAVTYAGATPVPVEPDETTYNLDVSKVERVITSRTRAILPVHLYGQAAEMDELTVLARRRSLAVIADAAQAHGARYKGKPVAQWGDLATFSFYPTKNLGALGDGGAILTDRDDLAEKLRKLRNYGALVKYKHDTFGINSRLDELQAAFLRVKLRKVPAWNQARRALATYYLTRLRERDDLVLPTVPSHIEPVWHLFVVQHPERDRLQAHLSRAGIDTLIHYPIPPHLSGPYAHLGFPDLSVTERIASRLLSLPMGPHVMDAQREQVVATLLRF